MPTQPKVKIEDVIKRIEEDIEYCEKNHPSVTSTIITFIEAKAIVEWYNTPRTKEKSLNK